MGDARGSVLDLRKGEIGPALKAFATLALLIGGHTVLETARDALLLASMPVSRLAVVYAVVALVALVVAGPNARFVRRFGEGRALIATLILAASGTLLLHRLEQTPTTTLALYVWSAFLSTVMVVQFWLLVARVFTPSQGRRLFGPIAAGGVVGAILGATGAALALLRVEVRALLLGAVLAYSLCALVATTLDPGPESAARRLLSPEPASPAEPTTARRAALSQWSGELAELRRQSPYVGRLAALTALSTATLLVADYLFKGAVAERVARADLGAYLARTYAVFNGLALVATLFVSGPLVRRLGVARAVLTMPVLLFGGAIGVLVTGAQAAVLITKGADGALRHSLHRVTSELLGLPIPTDLRPRVKALLEGALVRSVQAVTGAALFLLAAVDFDSPRQLAGVAAALAAAWIAAALGIRGPHLDMFRRAISKSPNAREELQLDERLLGVLARALTNPDPSRALAALDLLWEHAYERSIPASILRHPSEQVRARALEILAATPRADWIAEAERLLSASRPEPERVAAVRALGAGALVSREALAATRRAREDESPAVRAHVVVVLARAEGREDAASIPAIQELLAAPGESGRAGRLALLDAIRDGGDRRFAGLIEAVLSANDPGVMAHAVPAMARVRDPRFIPSLVASLRVRASRVAVRDALVDLGEPAQMALEAAMRDESTAPAVRLHLPRTLSHFANQRAADFLAERLALDGSRLIRYKVLRGLGRLVAETDVRVDAEAVTAQLHRNLVEHLEALARWASLEAHAETRRTLAGQLLLGLLEDKRRQALDRAFRLLHIAYRHEDIRRAYVALRSPDRLVRSSAVELLDELTAKARGEQAREARDLLLLAIDDLPAHEKVSRAASWIEAAPVDPEAALLLLVRDRDATLAELATAHARTLGLLASEEIAAERDRRSGRDD